MQQSLIRRWLAVTIAVSIVAHLDNGFVASALALAPARIWHGEVWRLVTWPFVELTPLSLILTCVAIYRFGGDLAYRWGVRRLRRFVIEVVLAASIATCLLDAVFHHGIARCGGWAIADMLLVAWARQFPAAIVQFYGVLQLNGRSIIRIVIATSIVYAIYIGPVAMAPELVACLLAATYSTKRLAQL
jgi:membrane associated rhomboid family serine protease